MLVGTATPAAQAGGVARQRQGCAKEVFSGRCVVRVSGVVNMLSINKLDAKFFVSRAGQRFKILRVQATVNMYTASALPWSA